MKTNILILLLVFSCLYLKAENHIRLDKIDSIKQDSINKKDSSIEVIEPETIDTLILGDINNDGISDTAYVYTPPVNKTVNNMGTLYDDCIDSNCFNKIRFSCNLPEINISNSVWGRLENIGDINHDGFSELIFSPNWFQSCWGSLYIYSFKNNLWTIIAQVNYRRCDDESLKSHVIKIGKNYYLKGLKLKNGDDVEYKLKIK